MMRGNSGQGDSENNLRDPTLDEQRPRSEAGQPDDQLGDRIGMDKGDGDQSPSARTRGDGGPGGEESRLDAAAERAR